MRQRGDWAWEGVGGDGVGVTVERRGVGAAGGPLRHIHQERRHHPAPVLSRAWASSVAAWAAAHSTAATASPLAPAGDSPPPTPPQPPSKACRGTARRARVVPTTNSGLSGGAASARAEAAIWGAQYDVAATSKAAGWLGGEDEAAGGVGVQRDGIA